jgi:hypothetical protein
MVDTGIQALAHALQPPPKRNEEETEEKETSRRKVVAEGCMLGGLQR